MHDSKDSKDLVLHQALGKSVVCKQSHCDLQSVNLLEETSSQDKEVYTINVFQTFFMQGKLCKDIPGEKIVSPGYFIFP